MTIRITYTQGNGYTCSCCRHESTRYEDFPTIEDAMAWLTEYHAANLAHSRTGLPTGALFWEDSDDRSIEDIREIGEDLREQLKPSDGAINALIQQKWDEYNAKKAKVALEDEKKAKEREQKEYERLKAKYDEAEKAEKQEGQ